MDTPILYVNQAGALCTFGGCPNRAEGRQHCPRHKAQLKAGKPLSPLREIVPSTFRDELGRKRCATCLAWLPVEAFYTSKTTRDGLHPGCRRCHRNRGIMKRFGITIERYDDLLAAQGGVCWICKKTPQANKKLLAVDHDHACCPTEITCGKCIRGLLCSCCNLIIGMIGDKPSTIANMAVYLHMNEGRLM